MGFTIAEKILGRTTGEPPVRAGENHAVRPDRMIAYDFPGYTDVMFRQMREDFGITELEDPSRYVVFIDHMLTKDDEREAQVHQVTRDWCEFYGIELHEAQGIGHQLTAELGLATPGDFLVHFDGHISGVGAFNALGWGIRKDLIEAWVSGQVYVDIPATTRFDLVGEFPEGVDSRDLVHTIIELVGADGCAHQVMEFGGPGARSMAVDHRQGLCGMAMFTGAVSAIFEPDDVSTAYARDVARHAFDPVYPDDDAVYAARHTIDLSTLVPRVVRPGSARVANTSTVAEMTGTPITRAFIGSCASGRIEDLRAAALVLDGQTVSPSVELNVVPTSKKVFAQAEEEGILDVLRNAGATIAMSSCDFCFGYQQPLQPDENCISTGVLNITGRMGSPDANIFMGSPYTVAASAITGTISGATK
ncbi:3-isopropylmalate dehydratase large subunit [Gordonia humi]|uniref:3-isopropylmalate/(R)-2-methylmalate dehydratase large subunit n=1 Tax=Gordonia humi TaxID=686429 RepID=A0A840F1Z7_9ACTN|nr:aconitase family protein [Gordonia humi]MBB4134350.1 3-isopropylmalate/(R)-2-methylmalate dehydratase large subunit [Gordonia humi]